MATALQSVAGLTVERIQVAPNQARILTAFHAVKVDSPSALPEGTQVTFTDTDLGDVFVGKIVKVDEAWVNGEGIRYTCADAYRTLTKTPASIISEGQKQTRLQFLSGTSAEEIITAIFNGSGLITYIPGGLNFNMTDWSVPNVDKGGQGVDTWLNDILQKDPGAIALVHPNSGSPRLDIVDFLSSPSVTLTIGTYSVINPATGELVLEGGNKGKSLDRKYEKILLQGCGYFKRYELQYMVGELYSADEVNYMYEFRWYIPDSVNKRILCRYIDDTGVCREKCLVRFKFGSNPDDIILGPLVFDWENPVFQTAPDGRKFFAMIVKMSGWFIVGEGFPTPNVSAWATYTIEQGPMSAEIVSSDPKLLGEGAYVEQHPEFIKYEGPSGNIDQSALLASLANALAARYCDAADVTGTFRVHVKGLNSNLQLGSPVTNFSNAKVQSIEYDIVARSMNLTLSTIPLRDVMKNAKQQLKDGTLEGGNWYQPKSIPLDGCFCDGEVSTFDENGNPSGGNPGGDPPDGGKDKKKSYDCNKFTWNCDERRDDGGAFKTAGDCWAACQPPELPFKFVNCVGCMAAQGIADGQYATMDECKAAHPNPSPLFYTGCRWHCDPGKGCTPGEAGEYATQAECLTKCKQTGSGYGTSSGGVGSGSSAPPPGSGSGGKSYGCPCSQAVKGISIGANGQVLGVSCADVKPPAAGSGQSGYCVGQQQSVTVLKDIVLNGDGTWTKYFVTLIYCGEAPEETSTSESCDCGGGGYGT